MSGQSQPGNKHGLKLKSPEIRQLAYKQYCEHLAKGKTKRSWRFRHPEHSCTWETMEKYIKDETEFDPIHKEEALADGLYLWEEVVEESAKGINKDANTASLQMIMRNKFGWDKEDKSANFSPQDLEKLSEFFAKFGQSFQVEKKESENLPNQHE